MSKDVVVQSSGASFPLFGIMFLIFMTLKLTGVIAWSWWMVTLPLWGPLAFGLGLMALAGIITLIVMAFKSKKG